MCDPISAGTAILIASGVSAFSSYQQGKMQASIANRNNEIMKNEIATRNAQLEEEKRIVAINAREEEEQRKQALRRNVASMKAYNRGLESESFLALVDYEENALAKDIANIRLGSNIERSRLATEISVNNTRSQSPNMASYYRKAGTLGALSSMAGGYADYKATQTPKKPPTTTTGDATGGYPNSGYTFKG